MNPSAEKHLTKAEGYLAKGEEFYRKAAEEIIAAQEADPMLGQREIGLRLGKAQSWVSRIVRWHTSDTDEIGPFSEASGKPNRDESGARKILREAPLEQVEQIIGDLSPERQQAVAAAAGHAYHKARQDYNEAEARLTPSERKAREAAAGNITAAARRASGGFAALGIVGHIEQATDELRELIGDASVTPEHLKLIEAATEAFMTELVVARGMAGLEVES